MGITQLTFMSQNLAHVVLSMMIKYRKRETAPLQPSQSLYFLQPDHSFQPKQRIKGPNEQKLCPI